MDIQTIKSINLSGTYIPDSDAHDAGTCIDSIMGNLHLALVNYERYKDFLEKVPYRRFLDLAAVVRLDVTGARYPVISNNFLNEFDITWEQLYEKVLAYRQANTPYVFDSLTNVIKSLGTVDLDPAMDMPFLYLLTNQSLEFGSSVILYNGICEDIYNKLGGEYVIIPANTNEVMIIPLDIDGSNSEYIKEIRKDVSEVNEFILKPEEFLSEGIYKYDSRKKQVELLN
ncbi:MAG: DUF5688 family protein [Eubacterium sp.]|nr:DUF5688 family protein [Eubacterium sp.]